MRNFRKLAALTVAAAATVAPLVGTFADPAGAIVNGSAASTGEYPWFVSLTNSFGGTYCGGTLVAPEWVLTAAHCLKDTANDATVPLWDVNATIGRDLFSNTAQGELISAAYYAVHPRFDLDGWMSNDLAMVRLSRPSTAQPLQVLSSSSPSDRWFSRVGATATAIGRGKTCFTCVGSNAILEVNVPIVELNDFWLTLRGTSTTCQGDSGGPALVQTQAGLKVAGVLSWGDGNCATTQNAYFTPLTDPKYSPWVRTMMHETPLVGDVNGDRKDDIVTVTHGVARDVFVAKSNGSTLSPSTKWHNNMGHDGSEHLLADVNGDRKQDLLTFDDTQVWVALSNGTSFNGGGWVQTVRTRGQVVLAGDMDNTDSRDDLVVVDRASGLVRALFSTGSAFSPPVVWHAALPITAGASLLLADAVTSDGIDDLVMAEQGNNSSAVLGADRFSNTWTTLHTFFGIAGETVAAGSLAGGPGDLFTFTRSASTTVYASQNFQAMHGASSIARSAFGDADDTFAVGDVNGDGASDLIRFTQDTTADVFVSLKAGHAGSYQTPIKAHDYFAP